MSVHVVVPDQTISAGAYRATRLTFFIAGFSGATWAALVPFAQARTNLGSGGLGLLLLCLGTGSILAMPISGAAAGRVGCRAVVLVATALVCLTLPILAVASNVIVLAVALFAFGAGLGSVDCVANIQAVMVERASGRPMMSGFHGLFSLGGILGAGGMAVLLSLGTSPALAGVGGTAILLAALLVAAPDLLRYGSEGAGPAFAWPRGIVLLIGAMCFVVFLAEGSALDWSAVFLSTVRGLEPAHSGIGYAAFAATMTAGRLGGDRIVRQLGGTRVILLGGLCAAAGFAALVLVPAWEAGVVGYALVGAGCSNIVPVLYSATGRQRTMPEHTAIPAISTLGYAGILAGPALIGFIANGSSLAAAFGLLALLLVGVSLGSRILTGLT